MLDAVLYIVESFYWKGIFADVKEFCKCCEVSTYKLTSTKASCWTSFHTSQKCGIEWRLISLALSLGNKYIITLCDYFSKWPEAAPLPSKEATGVANFLLDTCRHGWPKIILSDQGRECVNFTLVDFFSPTKSSNVSFLQNLNSQTLETSECQTNKTLKWSEPQQPETPVTSECQTNKILKTRNFKACCAKG